MNPQDTYKEEAYERLTELENALLELEESPTEELIGQIFRALHTIKGSGAMFGFDDIAAFTHEVETVFDLVRNGKVEVSKELIDLTLKARDLINSMLEGESPETGTLVASFKRFIPREDAPAEEHKEVIKREKGTVETYRVRFSPSPEIFATGTNPLLLLNELRDLGEAIVTAEEHIPPPERDGPRVLLYLVGHHPHHLPGHRCHQGRLHLRGRHLLHRDRGARQGGEEARRDHRGERGSQKEGPRRGA